MEKRYIGIELHRNRFTCCIRLENARTYVTEWALADLGKFVKRTLKNGWVFEEFPNVVLAEAS